MLPLTATALGLRGTQVTRDPCGPLLERVEAHLNGSGPAGLVLLGGFGSGKSTLCEALSQRSEAVPRTVVPLRLVARAASISRGLNDVIGTRRLEQAQSGARILLLDGLDEVRTARDRTSFFDELTRLAGPRWLLTSRPGYFRTSADIDPEQVDTLSLEDMDTLAIDPLPVATVRAALTGIHGGSALVDTVEGLVQLATSPLLLHVVHAAIPFIEPGRPIHAWGAFDAWIRHALHSGPGHADALARLEELAWHAFEASGFSLEVPHLSPHEVARWELPRTLVQGLFVTELDGALRFGHRSVYEFLLACRIAPALQANQGHGPDRLSGIRVTEAMRFFLEGRTGPHPGTFDPTRRRLRVPRGNFIAGGDRSPDERPLRIQHLAEPFSLATEPVTHRQWRAFLEAHPADRARVDANYLPDWGVDRSMPEGLAGAPIYGIWPEDADRYAAWRGARLPTANEWEKAVRGLDGRLWPWGNLWRPNRAVTSELGVERPLPVNAFGAQNETGLRSAIGGVFEYTATPWRDRANRGRVVMGGCWTHPHRASRASLRLSHKLSGNLKAGLRLAWSDT